MAGRINRHGQFVGSKAFVTSRSAAGERWAFHMECTNCRSRYFAGGTMLGKRRCPSCDTGSPSVIPKGEQVHRNEHRAPKGADVPPMPKPETPPSQQPVDSKHWNPSMIVPPKTATATKPPAASAAPNPNSSRRLPDLTVDKHGNKVPPMPTNALQHGMPGIPGKAPPTPIAVSAPVTTPAPTIPEPDKHGKRTMKLDDLQKMPVETANEIIKPVALSQRLLDDDGVTPIKTEVPADLIETVASEIRDKRMVATGAEGKTWRDCHPTTRKFYIDTVIHVLERTN